MKLEQLQQLFSDALLDPSSFDDLRLRFQRATSLDERFAYYRGNLSGIWMSALRNAYPVLWQLVGDDFFAGMAKSYGRAFPSQSGDLNQFGAHLSEFLQCSDFLVEYPYFTDVARLEWQMHCAYYAADAAPLSLREALLVTEQSGRDLASARVVMHPAATLFQASSSSVDIWLAHQHAGAPLFPNNVEKENFGLITRPQWQVSLFSLTKADYLGLHALFQGDLIGDALDVVLTEDATFDIGRGLQRWFSEGTFAQINFS